MSEREMDEMKIARITGVTFGLLWLAMLGLHMLSGP
jgi:hypothetical protein